MNKRRLKLWARSPTIIILGLFLLAALHYSLKYPMAYSESQTLVYAKQYADPGFLPGDWYLSQYQPTRIPYQVFVYPLVQTMPLQDVSLWARLLGYLVAAAGLGLIGHRLRLPAPYIWIALGLFIFLDQAAIPGREWIFRRAESKVIAYGLVLFAVRALMDRRIATAGMLGGLATTMHILVGFWASVALGLTILAERLGSWRARVVAGLSWCMGTAYAFYAVFVRLGEPSASAGFDVSVIWNDFRNPHYTDISRWPWDEPRALLLWFLCVAALVGVPKLYPARQQLRVVSRFALFTLVPFEATLLLAPTPFGATLTHYLPFRVADTLIPLFGLLVVVPAAFRHVVQPRARALVAAVAVIALTIFAWEGFADGLEHRREFPRCGVAGGYGSTTAFHNACEWVRERTPVGSLLLVSPENSLVNYLCERPVIVSFRNIPSSDVGIEEWYARLVDLNGGEQPYRTGYAAADEIDHNFHSLPDADYLRLGRKYGARYLLLYGRATETRLPRLFRDRDWSVHLLSSRSGTDAATPTTDTGN